MDTGETYITMCRKAAEIQELRILREYDAKQIKRGDYYCTDVYHKVEVAGDCVTHSGEDIFDYLVWLPRQDQLQDILRYKYDTENMLVTFYAWCRGYYIEGNYVVDYKSMEFFKTFEQLWLAFVMKEKYGLVWDKNDWINEQK